MIKSITIKTNTPGGIKKYEVGSNTYYKYWDEKINSRIVVFRKILKITEIKEEKGWSFYRVHLEYYNESCGSFIDVYKCNVIEVINTSEPEDVRNIHPYHIFANWFTENEILKIKAVLEHENCSLVMNETLTKHVTGIPDKNQFKSLLECDIEKGKFDFFESLNSWTLNKIKDVCSDILNKKSQTPFRIEYVVNPFQYSEQMCIRERADAGKCPIDFWNFRLKEWEKAEKLRKYEGWRYEGFDNLEATYEFHPYVVFLYKKKAYPRMESQPNENDKWLLRTQLNSHHTWEFQTLEQFESICKDLKIKLHLKEKN